MKEGKSLNINSQTQSLSEVIFASAKKCVTGMENYFDSNIMDDYYDAL